MFQLITERLSLRQFQSTDAESMVQVFGDPEVMRFGDGVKTRDWVQDWLRSCRERYERWGFGPYAIVQRENQEVIGYCGLFSYEDVGGQAEIEIGYRLKRSAWGQGYATEAARAVREYAFAELRIKRLIALIDPSNISSIRVAEKVGMRYEKDVMLEGYDHPDHVYVITSE